jgi:RHS repeat-associated protein
MNAGTDPASGGSVISLPSGGGAVSGLGEKFSPDLFTGTGNFSVPITLPHGRQGATPQLTLAYSTGNGNGPFGLGWALSVPGVARKTSRGVPRYDDSDVFILFGAEDLVPVPGAGAGWQRYRPRTEGLFARIEHVQDASGDYWEVRSKDGTRSRYGTPRPHDADPGWHDPAITAAPGTREIFAWRLTETADPCGNLVRYTYLHDHGDEPGHLWNQPLVARVDYADYGDRDNPAFLVGVEIDYEPRPDPFSDYRAGFEIRSTLRCRTIRVATQAADGVRRVAREYRFSYQQASFNGASLLTRVDVVGIDESTQPPEEPLPPLTFGYAGFDPARRRFRVVTGPGLPMLDDKNVTLVDLRGNGLPDIVELGAAQRYWANRGDGRFDLPRPMTEAPPHALGDPGVQFLDADADGRPDLLVMAGAQAGYFPMRFAGGWSGRSFQPYRTAPSVGLDDPSVKLVDLDGDGLTDLLHSGSRLECWFNHADPRRAWRPPAAAAGGPDLDLADPHVQLADMTGDGLQDIVLVRSGNIAYWPNLGHGRFGPAVQMRQAPRLPDGHDPRRLLLGDVDGDGVADLVYVDRGRVLLWGNRTGNGWTPEPVTVTGTPDVVDVDAVQLADLHGTGMAGLLWSTVANGSGSPLRFLDLTGDVKPYLLDQMDNHLGATTRVEYRPSTSYFLFDQVDPGTRWGTTLPFPVHVVARVEVTDAHSGGRLVTEYRYHHGYWDGVEREFRGFAMVEQLDTETFHGGDLHYSPPTLTRSWFHPGPVAAAEAGDWTELDLSHEYWPEDPPQLGRPPGMLAMLAGLPRPDRRDALRALRGQVLRTELYALDGTDRADRPYTVTESLSGVRAVADRVWFPFAMAQRTTQWERGSDPMTQFAFTAGYDEFGLPSQQLAVAVPRGRDPRVADPAATQPYLATYTTTEYARRDGLYVADRVARTSSFEVVNDGRMSVDELHDAVLGGAAELRVIGHSRTFYDGPRYVGLPLGELGDHGLPVRTESLAFTDAFLDDLFPAGSRPPYLDPSSPMWSEEYPAEFRELVRTGYRHYRDGEVPGSPGGYYVADSRHAYDVHDPSRIPRGLPIGSLDPFGAESHIGYDGHDLLPTGTTNPAGLVTTAAHDLRVLQSAEVTDVNGNTSSVTFSPAGFVTSRFVRGKNGEGDAALPSVRMRYDLLAFVERRQPVSTRSERRVHHDTAVPAGEPDDVIVSVEYSDGFGRLLQTRAQAEDTLFGDPDFGGQVIPAEPGGPAPASTGHSRADNVVVSGWQTYDNKGQVVEKYEPFFTTGFDYATPRDSQLGEKATIFYDPRGYPVRTVNPDGSEYLVVHGVPVDLDHPDVFAPTPWESFSYDANDNAGRTHGAAAEAYRHHWNTPASTEVDALGRTVVAVARNGPDPDTDWHVTRSSYDIQGNLTAITDALGRRAFEYRFDLAKRRWRMDSIDAGRRDTVPDALSAAVETRDAKGALTLDAVDRLHRPIRVWARDDADGHVALRQHIEYGDAGDPAQPDAERQAARTHNLLGRPVAHYDEAGLVTVTDVDFKGNVLDTARQVIADAPLLAGYQQAAADGWRVPRFVVDWQPGAGQTRAERDAELLESTVYRTSTRFDALNRITRHILPVDVEGRRREIRPRYNRAGGLEQVELDGTGYVRRIAYDAKGQRTLIAYGNGVLTRYARDRRTFRLARLRSERYTLDGLTYRPSGPAMQDHGYGYDLAGNILTIRDRTPGSGIANNPAAFAAPDPALGALLASGDALDREFGYDPSYRLLTATGRECDLPPDGPPWLDAPRGTDLTRTRAYTETYTYDAVGSMLRLAHRTGPAGYVREFDLASASNRLLRMTVGSAGYDYTFDANGNTLDETTSRHFAWNHADQLSAFAIHVAGAEPSIHAQYLYDAAGERVKKLVRHQGGQVEVTHYLGHLEHHRWTGTPASENNHVHVMDDRQRIALVRIGPASPGDRGPAVQFHLADHLGSSTVVVDDSGSVTNREEYTPYGETGFGSFARKRYRFTGEERDEESGLSYHGTRYYAPWNGRWLTCDPVGPTDLPNAYVYGRNCPHRLTDPGGSQPEDVEASGSVESGSDERTKTAGSSAVGAKDAAERERYKYKSKAASKQALEEINRLAKIGGEEAGLAAKEAAWRASGLRNQYRLETRLKLTRGGRFMSELFDKSRTVEAIWQQYATSDDAFKNASEVARAAGRSNRWISRISRGLGVASLAFLVADTRRGILRIRDEPPETRPGVIGDEAGGLLGGIGGFVLGGAIAASALVGAPIWAAVAGTIAIGGALGFVGSKLGSALGSFIGSFWNRPSQAVPNVEIPSKDEFPERVGARESAPPPEPQQPTPNPLMRMRAPAGSIQRAPTKPALSVTKTY